MKMKALIRELYEMAPNLDVGDVDAYVEDIHGELHELEFIETEIGGATSGVLLVLKIKEEVADI